MKHDGEPAREGEAMKCPHCGREIDAPVAKIHYPYRPVAYQSSHGDYTACDIWTMRVTADKDKVTCLNCKKTKAFREAK